MGGESNADSTEATIDFVVITTTGNATDFGDLSVEGKMSGTASSHTRGVIFAGVGSPAIVNTIDYITIATTGNSADFGDLISVTRRTSSGNTSDSHGGLQG